MRCGTVSTFYAYPSPSGGELHQVNALDLSAEGATCSGSQYVVVTQTEFDQFTASPMRLTLEEGGLIAGAVLGLWAAAWGIRVLVSVIRENGPEIERD